MDRLQGVEEYKVLLKKFRKEHKMSFSNLYLMFDDMERYISLGRVEYEEKKEGLFFYFDEESYYRVCMCVETGVAFHISRRDKKILVRNMYRKDKPDNKLIEFEKILASDGFDLVGTSFQIRGRTNELWQKCLRLEKYVLLMQEQGYRCIEADYSRYREIEKLILDSGVIKDYQMNYLTEQEKQMMKGGSYLCVLDNRDQICAACISFVNNGVAQDGVIAVKEEYKMKGIVPILSYHRFKWLCMNKVDLMQGWVLLDNEASIRYHKSLGFQFMDKYANEWILEKVNE